MAHKGTPKPEPGSEAGGPERTLAEIAQQEAEQDGRPFAFVLQELVAAIQRGQLKVCAILGVASGEAQVPPMALAGRLDKVLHYLGDQDDGFADSEARMIAIAKEAHERYRKGLGKAPFPERFWHGHEGEQAPQQRHRTQHERIEQTKQRRALLLELRSRPDFRGLSDAKFVAEILKRPEFREACLDLKRIDGGPRSAEAIRRELRAARRGK